MRFPRAKNQPVGKSDRLIFFAILALLVYNIRDVHIGGVSVNYIKQIRICVPLLLILLLTGCFAIPTEPPALPPPMLAVRELPPIPAAPVARGDIQMTANPSASYLPVREERLYFSEADVPVQGIFVSVGDEVRTGDIIAALYLPQIEAELENLLRAQADMELRLRQVEERRNLALSLAAISGIPVDDTHFLESRANIRADLAVLQMDIDYTRQLYETRFLRASMDGVVNRVAPFIIDMRSNPRQLIAIITDHNYTAFVVTSHFAEFMQYGDFFNMTVNDETFLMQVVNPDEVGFVRNEFHRFEAFLVFIDTPPTLRGGERGHVHVIFGEVYDVLYIPTAALRRVGYYRTFVYVLEDGLRTVRDVVIGLEGDHYVEIKSGLAEGELVVI